MRMSPAARPGRFTGPAVILLAAFAASVPQLVHGNSCGHDFDFHLVSWLDAAHSWRQGILYPHWAPSANYGAGEPRFVFYPPLTWMLGAALGLALPWKAVPIALTFLLLAGTGLATRALARYVLDEGPATLAGCVAIFSGYALFTAYERSAFGELTGGFWIPLLLLLALRDRNATGRLWQRALDGSAALLALVVAGAWLSDVPLGVMASYLLAVFALAVALLNRSWAPVLRAAAGTVTGLGLSAFFLTPAAVEQNWVAVRDATDEPGMLIENSWLFARHADPLLQLHDVELRKVSIIALSMLAVALASFILAWKRRSISRQRGAWIALALIPAVVLFLMLPASLPVWNLLPKLRFLQFPWRWLVAVEAPLGVLFASAVWTENRKTRGVMLALCAGAALLLSAFTAPGRLFFQPCDEEDAVWAMLDTYHTGTGFEGEDEYAPPRADTALLATDLPDACLSASATTVLGQGDEGLTPDWSPAQGSCDATFSWSTGRRDALAEHLRLDATASHAGYLILRLRSYPAWRVQVNGQAPRSMPERADGLMAVPVAQGPVELTVDWTTTEDVVAGRWLTVIGVALFAGLVWLERRNSPPHL